jgi:hypothetical protein
MSQSRISYDIAHRYRVDRIVSGDSHDSRPVRHHDVFALAKDPESCLL